MAFTKTNTIRNIGFISTRFKGNDGVSLETLKWVKVLERLGYRCYFFSGLSDWDAQKSVVVEEAFFGHPEIEAIQDECFNNTVRDEKLTGKIQSVRYKLKSELYKFISLFNIELLIPQNALTIPMNIPLGLAITELVAETGIPVIAHHHDFSWERQRFSVNCVEDYLSMAFPPKLSSINHVVINSEASRQLSHRCGLSSMVIPNVLDFDTPPPEMDDYARKMRSDIGVKDDETLLLQPTRIVARKGIEHAIELASRLKDKKAKLLISHHERDEGSGYFNRTMDYAALLGVDVLMLPELIGARRSLTKDGRQKYNLDDCYLNADFVTYPSTYEGFGNAFLEAIWFKKPVLVNRYSIFQQDIEPLAFEVVIMENYVTNDAVDAVRRLLENPAAVSELTKYNYKIAQKYFSYTLLEQKLKQVLSYFG